MPIKVCFNFSLRLIYPSFIVSPITLGFVSGCPHKDAFAARLFADAGLEMIVACSFAKNFGLYGERTGALHFVASSPDYLPNIASQLRVISRSLYSTCPAYGARIVSIILGDPVRRTAWESQCREMAVCCCNCSNF